MVTDCSTMENLLTELSELSFDSSEESDSRVTYEKITERIFKNCRPNVSPMLFYSGRLFKSFISRPVLAELLRKIDHTAIMQETMDFLN
jgi:hypothetical protein